MSAARFLALVLLALGALLALVLLFVSREIEREKQVCREAGAERVGTGRGMHLCVSPNGRIVRTER